MGLKSTGRVAVVSSALVLVIVLAAAATAGTQRHGAQTSVTIGVLGSVDGAAVKTPNGVAAIQGWAREVNAKGGLVTGSGRKVRVNLEVCNSKNDPNLATACARQFVTDNAAAVIGNDPPVAAVSMALLDAAKIPSVGLFATAPLDFTSVYSYPLDASGFLNFPPAINVVAKKYSPIASFVSVDVPAGRTNSEIVKQLTTPPVNWVSTVFVPFTTADFAPVVANVAASHPKSILLFTGAQMGGNFIRAAEQANAGFDHYVFNTVDLPTLASLSGPARAKIVVASAWQPTATLTKRKNKMLARLIVDLKAQYKSGNADARPDKLSTTTWNYFLAGVALEQVVKKIKGNITAASIKTGLDSAKNLSMGGVAGPWTPSTPGPSPAQARISNQKFWVYQYQANGIPKLLWPTTLTGAQAAKIK